jgi:hypothetical protein
MKEHLGPKFIQYLNPVLKALKELGGSGRPAEVVEKVAQISKVSEADQQETLKSGALKFDKQVAFARQFLFWGGYLDDRPRSNRSDEMRVNPRSSITQAICKNNAKVVRATASCRPNGGRGFWRNTSAATRDLDPPWRVRSWPSRANGCRTRKDTLEPR